MRLKALKIEHKVKIVEKPGQKFIDILKMKNKKPNRKPCNDPECLIGRSEKGGNCRKNEVVYMITCKNCKDKYVGETARNGHTRGIEHIRDGQSNNPKVIEKSVIQRHKREKHQEENVEFEMKILSAYQHDPLSRQCSEAIWIRSIEASKRINNKKEFHQPGEVEITYSKNVNEDFKRKTEKIKRSSQNVNNENKQVDVQVDKVEKYKKYKKYNSTKIQKMQRCKKCKKHN